MIKTLYTKLAKPVLFTFSPDTVHATISTGLKWTGSLPPAKWMAKKIFRFESPLLETTVCGLHFKNPIGLSAGFDANGTQAAVYDAMGFGFAEIGSITFHAQPGNPKPHYARLIEDQSLIVHKGLQNLGIRSVVDHLKRLRNTGKIHYPLGLSIARTTAIEDSDTAQDYLESFRIAVEVADYVTLNVSCPNVACFTPEQQLVYVEEILKKIDHERRTKNISTPIWIKFGPDLQESENHHLIDLCLTYHVDAIVLTNLVKDRKKLTIKSTNSNFPGGVSGKLLQPFSLATLKYFSHHLKGRIPIISVGGVFTADDAYARFHAGASLIQLITGWVFEGPTVLKDINRGLVERMKQKGHIHLSDISKSA